MSNDTPEFSPEPTTAEELTSKWAARDDLYAQVRTPMDPVQEEVIRQERMKEANRLPNPKERGRMYHRAKSWVAPTHPDFGGLRDWL